MTNTRPSPISQTEHSPGSQTRRPPVVLVTGASRGIGSAICDALEAQGARVIRHASKNRGGDEIGADFRGANAPDRLWRAALERAEGRIDALINNAGLFTANPLDQSDANWTADWQETLQINLTAAAELSRLAVLHWQERAKDCAENTVGTATSGERGRIVHIASRAAYRGDSPAHWHYAAAKGGMIAMHKTIARHYASLGIYSYAICPGFTDTAMAGDYLESRGGPGLLADIPLGRVAEPEEIASIASYCALQAPPSMTGAVIDANGASYVR